MDIFIQNFIAWIDSSKYVLLYLGAIPEGPVLMVTGGFLYHLGKFNLWPMYLVLVLGDFTADIIWYSVGRFGTRQAILNYGHFIGVTPIAFERVEGWFKRYHQKILIISKFTMGLGFALVVLITAGMSRVPFKNYIALNLFGGFIWSAVLIAIGYFFGNIFTLISGPMKIVFLGVVLIAIVLGVRFLNNYLKN